MLSKSQEKYIWEELVKMDKSPNHCHLATKLCMAITQSFFKLHTKFFGKNVEEGPTSKKIQKHI